MLTHLLDRPRPSALERLAIGRALAHPACWPVDPTLAARAEALGWRRPAAVRPGETLLVSVAPGRASLWQLCRPADTTGTVGFVGAAQEELQRAERIATRDVPILLQAAPLDPSRAWRASFLARSGTGVDDRLDGTSFGLSIFLACASTILGLPLPADSAASAALANDGALLPVGGLEEKIAALAAWAPGLRRFVVASTQADEARRLARRHDAPFSIVGAPTAAAALETLLGDVEAAVAGRLTDAGARDESIHALFDLALRGVAPILAWGPVERGARLLAGLLQPDDPRRFQVDFAEQVARRHQGKPASLPEPSPAQRQALQIEVEHAWMAHVIQSATDAADSQTAALLRRIDRDLPPPHRSFAGQLRVHGAIGRALLGQGRLHEAADRLAATVAAWQASGLLGEISRPLCAWLHAIGLLEDRQALEGALQVVERLLAQPGLAPTDRAYVAYDCGRSHALLGLHQQAHTWLQDEAADWDFAPVHLQRSRLRWLAATCRHLGDGAGAGAAMALLRRTPEAIQTRLAELDAAIETGDGIEARLAACRAAERQVVEALIDDALPLHDRALRLARAYPY